MYLAGLKALKDTLMYDRPTLKQRVLGVVLLIFYPITFVILLIKINRKK